MTPTTQVIVSSPFERIIAELEMVAAIGAAIPSPISGASKLADYLLKIVQATMVAHQSITGQPLDMSKLHQITPVP